MTLKLFNRRQLAIERAERVTGTIRNGAAKPARRFEAETEPISFPPLRIVAPPPITTSFEHYAFKTGQSEPSALGWKRSA